MATIGKRASTWSNPDGLVVGYGPNKAATVGSNTKNYGGAGSVKSALIDFTYKDLTSVSVPIPAGSRVLSVALDVQSAFVGGTSLAVGVSGTTDGFIPAATGVTANLGTGAHITGAGTLLTADTDTTAMQNHFFSAAGSVILTVVGTFTAGVGSITVNYT